MLDAYLLLKLVHIGAAIVAVGANLTYGFWMARAGRDRVRLVYTIESIRRLDRGVANPAYIVLLMTGLAMVLTGAWSLTTFWIATAIVFYVLTAIVGITVYAPAIRRQLSEAELDPSSGAYASAAWRSNVLGVLTLTMVAVILGLMVLKPAWPLG